MPLTRSTMDLIDREMANDPEFAAAVEADLQAMHIEQDLIALREQSGVSQEQLARRLGISQPAIAKLEAGKNHNIGLQTLVRYARALGGEVQLSIRPRARRFRLTRRARDTNPRTVERVITPATTQARGGIRGSRKRTQR